MTERGHAGLKARGVGASYYLPSVEDVVELSWPTAVRVYDRMRKSDSKVASALRAMMLPITAGDWRVEPRQARPEVVERLADDLGLPILDDDQRQPVRTRDRFDFRFHLRHALLSRVYGFMPFEQVYRIDGEGFARIRKLAPRMPHTLTPRGIRLAVDGGLEGIEQQPPARAPRGVRPQPVFIPIEHLVMYVHEREGYNWHGQSILRPVYRDWLLKDHYHRIAAIAVDRNGAGVPIYEDSGKASGSEEAELEAEAGQELAESYRAGESAGGRIPNGASFKLHGVEGQVPDILAYIRYHDEAIAQNTLEMFSTLPSAPNGSRALGQTLVDFFITALNSHAMDIATTMTNHIVEDWVEINYGPNEPPPAVGCGDIAGQQQLTATSIKQLIDCGALTATPETERYLRRYYRIPQIEPGETEPEPEPGPAPAEPTAARTPMGRYQRLLDEAAATR